MNKVLYTIACFFIAGALWAGNPDRQGEAGAPELLMNPWAGSAGLHTLNTSSIMGVEAMRLNIAGLSRIDKTEVAASYMDYLSGTDVGMFSLGLGQRIGKNGVLGLSLASLDFGDIPVTTASQPEGTGATFSPRFFHLGLGYSHMFANKISVGILVRSVNQAVDAVSASTIGLDAGVQYVTGEKDQFKFGISLRNIGSAMSFEGEALTTQTTIGTLPPYELTIEQRASRMELQATLNIGGSYDFLIGQNQRLTAIGNFTANSFARDNIGAGLEFAFRELFFLRGGYRYEVGTTAVAETDMSIYNGLSGGAGIAVPLGKSEDANTFVLDYAYRSTRLWGGSHNIGVKFQL